MNYACTISKHNLYEQNVYNSLVRYSNAPLGRDLFECYERTIFKYGGFHSTRCNEGENATRITMLFTNDLRFELLHFR